MIAAGPSQSRWVCDAKLVRLRKRLNIESDSLDRESTEALSAEVHSAEVHRESTEAPSAEVHSVEVHRDSKLLSDVSKE